MKGLVWALYLLVQDPATGSATIGTDTSSAEGAKQSWAFTGVTYLKETSCLADAATFTKMPTPHKTSGLPHRSHIAYVCVLQPKPAHYKN